MIKKLPGIVYLEGSLAYSNLERISEYVILGEQEQ
jgi:hypothetical protein